MAEETKEVEATEVTVPETTEAPAPEMETTEVAVPEEKVVENGIHENGVTNGVHENGDTEAEETPAVPEKTEEEPPLKKL